MENNYFSTLNQINVNEYTEKKGNLTYLSWAYAWGELKKRYPDSTYTIYENKDGLNYHTDGRTCWVKTGVTVQGIENIEYLPVLDYNNKSIHLDKVTSFDVNKTIQRSLTKAVARHGLGLYVYAGEDLPEEEKTENDKFKLITSIYRAIKILKGDSPTVIADEEKTIGKSFSDMSIQELTTYYSKYKSMYLKLKNNKGA